MDQSFESIPSSFAPAVVGILAQHVYGYKPIPQGASDSVEIETDRENAASLARAIYSAIGIPMAICCLVYSFLYCSYPSDREKARMESLRESEMLKLVADDSASSEKCFQLLHDSELREVKAEEGIDNRVDIEIAGEEKSLLSH